MLKPNTFLPFCKFIIVNLLYFFTVISNEYIAADFPAIPNLSPQLIINATSREIHMTIKLNVRDQFTKTLDLQNRCFSIDSRLFFFSIFILLLCIL